MSVIATVAFALASFDPDSFGAAGAELRRASSS
jgi:hypothetical protein